MEGSGKNYAQRSGIQNPKGLMVIAIPDIFESKVTHAGSYSLALRYFYCTVKYYEVLKQHTPSLPKQKNISNLSQIN